jgi:hypothetical protein
MSELLAHLRIYVRDTHAYTETRMYLYIWTRGSWSTRGFVDCHFLSIVVGVGSGVPAGVSARVEPTPPVLSPEVPSPRIPSTPVPSPLMLTPQEPSKKSMNT